MFFSDNHDVFASDGRLVELGSQRGTAGFIAEWLNLKQDMKRYSYLDFYLGTAWISDRANLSPIYRIIFSDYIRQEAIGFTIFHSYIWSVRQTSTSKPTILRVMIRPKQ